jgi:glucose/arabinose dehydrogenase
MTTKISALAATLLPFALSGGSALAQSAGDPSSGKTYFEANCALCHAAALGTDGLPVTKQGPSLVGVVGRKAASLPGFTYSAALTGAGLTWDAPTLDHFLTSPTAAVPGTTMPIAVAQPGDRANVIAYLGTLKAGAVATPAAAAPAPSAANAPAASPSGDWNTQSPGVVHRIDIAALPPPFATRSAGNGPRVIKPPDGAHVSVPPGFTVQVFASGLQNPRLLRTAPNGDIFLAETGANRLHIFRTTPGADAPAVNQVFTTGLDRPFGIAFYPPGPNPQWLYVANNNSVVRFPYHSGDLTASGDPQIIVPKLTDSHGGHSTRDIAFSLDGKRMFISVGSGSNVAEGMSKKSPADIQAWEAEHGRGAAWDAETNRADILVTDPENKEGLHTYATGIRNAVGIAVDPSTGKLWDSTNERDGLGDDLVPDYVSSVKEHGFYGWPWYYMGNHEDPRHAGERPDLVGVTLNPDVPVQAHSASLELCFYPADASGPAAFPASYHGDIFAAFHGSWNRALRTGYKVVRVRMDHGVATGEYDDFLTGFVANDANVWGRPVGLAVAPDGALLMSEDGNGTIWRVAYAGH